MQDSPIKNTRDSIDFVIKIIDSMLERNSLQNAPCDKGGSWEKYPNIEEAIKGTFLFTPDDPLLADESFDKIIESELCRRGVNSYNGRECTIDANFGHPKYYRDLFMKYARINRELSPTEEDDISISRELIELGRGKDKRGMLDVCTFLYYMLKPKGIENKVILKIAQYLGTSDDDIEKGKLNDTPYKYIMNAGGKLQMIENPGRMQWAKGMFRKMKIEVPKELEEI